MLGVLTHPLGDAVSSLRGWPVRSQQQARRNAMVAATACAQRRAQREDVADFFAARYAAPTAPSTNGRTDRPGTRAHG